MWFLKPSSTTNLRYLRSEGIGIFFFVFLLSFSFPSHTKEKTPVNGVVTADTARAGVIYELRVVGARKTEPAAVLASFVRNRILFGSGNHQTRCTAYS